MKALVYDFDGVLVDSNDIKENSFLEIYRELASDRFEDILALHKSTPVHTRFEKMDTIMREIFQLRGDEATKRAAEWVQVYTEKTHRSVVECAYIEGAMNMIQHFQGKVPQYIASATPEKELRNIVRDRGIYDLFANVWGGPRPKTEMFADVCSLESIEKDDLLFFGDSASDWHSAKKFGCPFIAIDQGKSFDDFDGPVFKSMQAAFDYLLTKV